MVKQYSKKVLNRLAVTVINILIQYSEHLEIKKLHDIRNCFRYVFRCRKNYKIVLLSELFIHPL